MTAAAITQRCPRCEQDCDPQLFRSPNNTPCRWCQHCRDRNRSTARRRPTLDSKSTRRSHLRQKYGITPEEYEALRVAQNYRCAICGRHEDEVSVGRGRPRKDGTPTAASSRLVVDHCHGTNGVRGLLCANCNTGLGYFKDSLAALAAAMDYLSRYYEPTPEGRQQLVEWRQTFGKVPL